VCHADRVAEGDDAGGRADERFQVHERAGDLGGDPRLPIREERERRQRAQERQPGGGQQAARAACGGRHALGDGDDRQRGERRREELDRAHGDRVAAGQQASLRHGQRGRERHGPQHQAIAGQRRAASPAGGDQRDTGERHGEARPGHRARHAAVPYGGGDRHQHGRGADEQGRMAHARPRDPGVLHQDRPAIAHRAPREHGGAARGPDPGSDGDEQHGGGEAEAGDGEPARRQPRKGQLGHGHGGAPEQAGGGQRSDGGTAINVHGPIMPDLRPIFAISVVLRKN
jgi:hypothetical protein